MANMKAKQDFINAMTEKNETLKLHLTPLDCERYGHCFWALDQATNHKIEFDGLFTAYDFFTDVLVGKRPDVDTFTEREAFKSFYRLSMYNAYTMDLTDEERKYFCFIIYLSNCTWVMDPEHNRLLPFDMNNLGQGMDYVKAEYENMVAMDPAIFDVSKILSFKPDENGDITFVIKAEDK